MEKINTNTLAQQSRARWKKHQAWSTRRHDGIFTPIETHSHASEERMGVIKKLAGNDRVKAGIDQSPDQLSGNCFSLLVLADESREPRIIRVLRTFTS